MSSLKNILLFLVLIIVLSETSALSKFSISIDNSITGNPETKPGNGRQEKIVNVVINPQRVRFQFVRNQIILKIREINLFPNYSQLHNGTHPLSPEALQCESRSIPQYSAYYHIGLDLGTINASDIAQSAPALGIDGHYTCSSMMNYQLLKR